ncbi:hypothetical protein FHL15_001357 [Xylaria flabelliformis]|uniref:RING-type E3 ubiquitin transferase n=1 Tax=Xylaria flabelliformis TaxID=2512241 RepID=A0A553IBN2_9PEZI|nr:hypothetical protein FHL15_001357 [Xylaria flabelliformis]
MATGCLDEDLHSQILQLTDRQVSSAPSEDAPKCCVICLTDVAKPCRALPCKHCNFDYLCLLTWLEHRPCCPLCNCAVQEVWYDLGDGDSQPKVYKVPATLTKFNNQNGVSSRSTSISELRSSSYADESAQLYGDEAMRRRRSIYRHNLYSLHVGSNRRQPTTSRYRELSPELFRKDNQLVSRARMWLRRELRVFEFLVTSNQSSHDHSPSRRCNKVDYLVEYTIAILKTLDTQSSEGQAEEMLQVYIGRRFTRLLLHELRAWLKSPCSTLRAWDRIVQYANRNALPRCTNLAGLPVQN